MADETEAQAVETPPGTVTTTDPISAAIAAADAVAPLPEKTEEPAPAETPAEAAPAAPAAAAAPVAEESPEEVRHSQRLAELARRDKALRQQMAAVRAREAEIAAQQQKLTELEKAQQELATAAKADPWGTLKKLGVDTMEALARIGGDETAAKPDPHVTKLQERLDALERQRAEERKQAEEQAKTHQQQAVYRSALGTIHETLKTDAEKYEAILERGEEGVGRVFTALDAMYNELVSQGYSPGPPSASDIAAAANIVEQVFRQEELDTARRWAERKRFAGRIQLTSEPPTTDAVPAKAPKAASPSPTTLTSDLTREAPQKRKLLSDEERLKAALAIPLPKSS